MNENDLFNNPMVSAARQRMTSEQIEQYKKLGEQFYENFNFETGTHNTDAFDMISLEIMASVRSGLHPSCLTEDEKYILEEKYGKNWFIDYGYTEADFKEI